MLRTNDCCFASDKMNMSKCLKQNINKKNKTKQNETKNNV